MSEKVNLAAYFERIGFSGSIAPTLATLEQLHALHPAAIPFENIDAFLGLPVPLDQHSLEHKLLHSRRGGYCFEQNTLFKRVLRDLDFEVRSYAAHGLWWDANPVGRAPSHMCLVVDIGGVSYLSDVAFGSCTLTAPLKLRTDVEQTTPNDTFRLVPLDIGYRLEVKFGDVWRPAYRFELVEQTDADYAALNAQTAADHHAAGLLSVARAQPGLRTTLRDNLLSTYRPGEEPNRRILTSVEDIRAALSDTFGITPPAADLLDPALAKMLTAHPRKLIMPPVYVDPAKVHAFVDAKAFYDWLAKNHDVETEVWVRIFKKASGTPTINAVEGIEMVLCWGWIDAIRKSYDDVSFVQRYTRRGPKSLWSKVNQDNVAKLVASGQMTEHGMRHVEAAKADGRWAAAYKMDMAPPEALLAAIEANPKAMEFYQTLSAQNRFALTFRTHNLKTEAGRAKKIATFVAMLENGETIYPQGKAKKP